MALSNEQKAAGRKSVSLIAALLAANFAAQSPAAVTLKVTVLEGDKNIKVTGVVVIGSDAYPVADSNGKVKVYKDIDQFLRFMAATKALPNTGDVELVVESLQVAAPVESIGGDIQGKFKRQKAAYERADVVTVRELADRTQTEIDYVADGYETGSVRAQAALAEVRAQKAALTIEHAYNMAEIARLDALITP